MAHDLPPVISPRNQQRDLPQCMEHKAAKEALSLVFHFHTPLFVFVKNSH
jgi:hypothetical protein